MGQPYLLADKYLEAGIEPRSIFVEIGSERGEGSTLHLARLAERCNTILHSVDLSDHASRTLAHPCLSCHVQSGTNWIKDAYPSINRRVSLLYLDNFDWIWDVSQIPNWIQQQINQYRNEFSIDMNNDNCQQEHFNQMMAIMPYMADRCLVIADDTFLVNGAWSGKCGAVVVLLRNMGFKLLEVDQGGVVLARGH